MSRAVRNRENRRESQRDSYNEALCGAMVSITTYNGEVRMLDVHAAAPGSASMAGRMADGLLPTDD